MHRIVAALLAAMPCLAQAQANDAAPAAAPLFTLNDAIAATQGAAPAMEAAQANVAAAQAARTGAALRPNPQLQTQVENIAGSGPYGGFSQAETTVGLDIPVELGGKRSARIAFADARTDRAWLESAIARADIRLQMTRLYVDAIAADRRALTAADQLRIAHDALDAARVRVRAGRASPMEEQRADVARLNAQAFATGARRMADAARANLARRIGHPLPGPLDDATLDRLPDEVQGPAFPTGAATLAMAAAQADLALADAGVRLARSQRVPDLSVGPAIRRLEATHDNAAVLSLSIPIPLFNSGRAALAQAHAERTRAAAQSRMTALDVEQAITDAQAQADNAAAAARNATGPALAAARESARIARIGYREGKFGQIDLLDAERTLADTRLAAIDALVAYQNARAQLERLTAPVPQQGN